LLSSPCKIIRREIVGNTEKNKIGTNRTTMAVVVIHCSFELDDRTSCHPMSLFSVAIFPSVSKQVLVYNLSHGNESDLLDNN